MQPENLTHQTPPPKLSLGRRLLLFPPIRIVIALVWVLAFPYAFSGIFAVLFGAFAVARDVIAAAAGLGLYYLFVRVVEQRTPQEIAVRPALKEAALGFGWGAALISVSIGILALLGMYHITGVFGRWALWNITAMAILAGVLEELACRAIVFRISEEGLGTVWAIVVSSLLFGLAHGWNPNTTLLSCLAIALEAGVLLAAVYLWRRRLWAAIGVHAGWNFMEAAWGIPVSGNTLTGVFSAELTGPAWLTGGTFGPEAGLITLLVAGAASVYFLRAAFKSDALRAPLWRRRRKAHL